MLNQALFAIVLVLVVASWATAQSVAPENDFQFWSDTQFTKPLTLATDGKTDRLSLNFGTTLRMFDDATRLGDRRLSIGLDRRFSQKLSFGIGYTLKNSDETASGSETDHRFRLDGNLEFRAGQVGIRLRSRLEHIVKLNSSDNTRFRQRVLISRPIRHKGTELFSLSGSAETFYNFSANRRTRDEFIVGFTRRISPSFSVEPIVGLRRNRSASFRNVGIVGMNLRFRLPK